MQVGISLQSCIDGYTVTDVQTPQTLSKLTTQSPTLPVRQKLFLPTPQCRRDISHFSGESEREYDLCRAFLTISAPVCSHRPLPPYVCVFVLTQPHRWIRVRDLDDLSASLERLRRSIPEVFGNDAPQAEQQRRLVDLVSFVCSHYLLLESLTTHSGIGRRKDSDSIQLPPSRSLQPSWSLTRPSPNTTRRSAT